MGKDCVAHQAKGDLSFHVGSDVYGLITFGGTMQAYISVPCAVVTSKPPSLSHAQAAALPLVTLTGMVSYQRNGLKKGESVLVVGASGGTGSGK